MIGKYYFNIIYFKLVAQHIHLKLNNLDYTNACYFFDLRH